LLTNKNITYLVVVVVVVVVVVLSYPAVAGYSLKGRYPGVCQEPVFPERVYNIDSTLHPFSYLSILSIEISLLDIPKSPKCGKNRVSGLTIRSRTIFCYLYASQLYAESPDFVVAFLVTK
jgi:hypothetical protein